MNETQTVEPIELADQIELRLVDMSTGELKRYRSTVVDLGDKTVSVDLPADQGVPLRVGAGDEMIVAIWKDYADHVFKARVVSREVGRTSQLILTRPAVDQIRRTPRREFFRADTRITTRVHVKIDGQPQEVAAIMLDLSAGGCRLQSFTRLASDSQVALDLVLPFPPDRQGNDRRRPIRGAEGIVRMVHTPERRSDRRPLHFLGIEFRRLDAVTRNNLMRYVAFRQREVIAQLRKAGEDNRPAPGRLPLEVVEQRLEELERELADAGQEVPPQPRTAAQDSSKPSTVPDPEAPDRGAEPAPSLSEAGTDPPEASIDDLFAEPSPTPAAPAAEPLAPQPPTGTPTGQTVLLVEDEADLRGVLSEAMRADGYAVIEAGAGDEALLAAAAHPVDLVVTDLMMPRMNGWRLIASLRERKINAPVVIITAYMSEEGQEILASRDVSGFLLKPIDIGEMSRVLRGALPRGRPAAKPRILAVDDESDVRLLVTASLEATGYEVRAVDSGHAALVEARRFNPDLILLDIVMPGLNGFQVCERLREDPATAHIMVAMLTVKSSAEFVRKALSLKVSGYLIKPIDPATLVSRVSAILPVGAA